MSSPFSCLLTYVLQNCLLWNETIQSLCLFQGNKTLKSTPFLDAVYFDNDYKITDGCNVFALSTTKFKMVDNDHCWGNNTKLSIIGWQQRTAQGCRSTAAPGSSVYWSNQFREIEARNIFFISAYFQFLPTGGFVVSITHTLFLLWGLCICYWSHPFWKYHSIITKGYVACSTILTWPESNIMHHIRFKL